MRICFVFVFLFFTTPIFSQTLAIIGNKKISVKEFQTRYDSITKGLLQQGQFPPNKKQFLEDTVRYELGLQEARKLNLERESVFKQKNAR